LTAFHLDKLVQGGFLEAGYRRLSGRSGPGAGRPAKVYRPSDRRVEVAVPPRDYELAARILLEGMGEGPDGDRRRAVAARRVGHALGREAKARAGRRGARARSRALVAVLEDRGFQPAVEDDGVIRLRNCPFDALSADYRDTVCGLNLALIEGIAEGIDTPDLRATREDSTLGCCVALRPVGHTARGTRGRV
jgi:predicted ArsR family transcriptional regulator